MNPKTIAGPGSPHAGKVMRESRDSADHPTSLAIGVIFDETGSMGGIPVILQKKLATLMNLLISKGYVPHPQILFGAIGDANGDSVPLQIGQFESDITMDDNLTNIFLEGHGGGQTSETYELSHYFFARHTATDCWERRQQKGYFFTIGDENFYPTIRKDQVADLIGDKLQADLKTVDVVRELEERYHVFHIIAEQGGYSHNKIIEDNWRSLLGERVLLLEETSNVAELIAMTIGLCEGTIDIDSGASDLASVGVSAASIKAVRTALVPYASSGALAKNVSNLPSVTDPSGGGVTRL
jgi:hypothetical protein